MNSVKCQKILLSFLAVLLVLASCTTVSFEVEHPPIVDMRNVKTITVMPFERIGSRRNERLSKAVTSALIYGIRMGKIEYVDPKALENIPEQNYWKYVDVYITGRITSARTDRNIVTKEETYRNDYSGRGTHRNDHSGRHETVTRIVTTSIITTVEIDYSYIRSVDKAVLARFRKSETSGVSYDYPEDRNGNRRSSRSSRGYQQGRGLDTETAENAIAKFSYTMSNELGPYTTTEKRNVKGSAGNNQLASQANRLIRQDRYEEALAIYSGIYEQNSSAAAGYNTAILLAANEKYADALKLLTNLQNRTLDAGKKSPSFIKKEIKKLTEFINGVKLLEAYRKDGDTSRVIIPAGISEAAQQTVLAKVTGTANIHKADVYALNGPISSADDTSVFTKMVAYTSANNGQWSMDVPDGGQASLWFLLIEDDRYFYISKAPLNISATVALNTTLMNRLE
jgi:hypothetical protein